MIGTQVASLFAAIGADLSGLVDGLRQADERLKESSSMFQDYGDVIDEIERKGTRLGMTLSAVGAAAIALATDFAMTASRTKEQAVVMEVVGRNAGIAKDALHEAAQAIKDQGIESQIAYKTVTELTRAELDLGRGVELANAARDAAVISDENTSQALEGIIRGIRTLNPLILKNYGYTVDLQAGYQAAAQAQGVAVTALSTKEKQLIATNIVMEQAVKIEGAYEEAMGSASKQIRSMPRYIVELKEAYGEHLVPVLDAVVGKMIAAIKWFTALPEPLQKVIAYGTLTVGVFAGLFGGLVLIVPQVAKTIEGFSVIATVVKAVVAPTLAATTATEGLALAQAHATATSQGLNVSMATSGKGAAALGGTLATVGGVVTGVGAMVLMFNATMKQMEKMFEPLRAELGDTTDVIIRTILSIAPGGASLYDGLQGLQEILGTTKTAQEDVTTSMEETKTSLEKEYEAIAKAAAEWDEYYSVLKRGAGGRDTSGRPVAPPHYTYGTGTGMAEGGVVTSPTLTWIGENYKPEAVIPLDKLQEMRPINISFNIPPGVAADRGALSQLAREVARLIKSGRGSQTAFVGGLA